MLIVPLRGVLYKRKGQTAEGIAQTYPHLSLSQVYAALAYYHAHRNDIAAELAAADALYDELHRHGIPADKTP